MRRSVRSLIVGVFSLLVIVPSMTHAACTPLGSSTGNISLCKPAQGETGWAAAINSNWDTIDSKFQLGGLVSPSAGGTGLSSYSIGDILYASGMASLASLTDVTTGNVLLSGGVGMVPFYGKVDLTAHITGVLSVANGGTGTAVLTPAAGGLVYSTASALAIQPAGTSGYFAQSGGTGAPTWLNLFGTVNSWTAIQTMSGARPFNFPIVDGSSYVWFRLGGTTEADNQLGISDVGPSVDQNGGSRALSLLARNTTSLLPLAHTSIFLQSQWWNGSASVVKALELENKMSTAGNPEFWIELPSGSPIMRITSSGSKNGQIKSHDQPGSVLEFMGVNNALTYSTLAKIVGAATPYWTFLGSFQIAGSISGAVTLSVPAVAGTNTLTLPAGTTDFSASGGASQVVKQTTLGGALTVAQLACADLSTAGGGCTMSTTASGDLSGTLPAPTVVKVNSVTYPASPTTNTVPVVTALNTVTYEAVPNAALANSAITIAGTSTSLGGSITQDTITGLASTGLVKRTGLNTLGIGVSGTDYAPATGTTSALKGNGTGGFAAAACGDLTNGATGCSTATGISGATLPLLNGINTASALWTFTSGLNVTVGNVGIGTASPSGKVTIDSPSALVTSNESMRHLILRSTDAVAADLGPQMSFSGSSGGITTPYAFATMAGRKEGATAYAGYLQFATTAGTSGIITEAMRITSTGNVGIGTTTPSAKLTISGAIPAAGSRPSSGLYFTTPNNANVVGQIGLVQNTTEGNHYLLLQSVEDTVSFRNVVLARDGGKVGIGVSAPNEGLEMGSTLNIRIPNIKATTGVRYVCVDTNGTLTSQAAACSGT